ncbi:MAG: hypothetical protein AB8B64_22955 [Granulosicoccus sp.]
MNQALNSQNLVRIPAAGHLVNIGNAKKSVLHAICASIAWFGLTLSPAVSAIEFQCEAPGDIRYLRVDIPGEEYLCEVSVTYQESGVREVKWYARNDTLFCSARAYELRDKYQDLWNYTCTTQPDRDGIDTLSATQRAILDQRLKLMIEKGRESTPAASVTGIKAVASTPLNNESGKVAFQFFTDDGADVTEIIDDKGDTWDITTSIDNMSAQVVSEVPVSAAVIHSISAEGTLEVHTQLTDEQNLECFGTQDLTPTGSTGTVKARTPHRFICNTSDTIIESISEAALLDSETQTQ